MSRAKWRAMVAALIAAGIVTVGASTGEGLSSNEARGSSRPPWCPPQSACTG